MHQPGYKPHGEAGLCLLWLYSGLSAAYADSAQRLGTALATRGCGLVYGAGSVGLMGILADAVLAGGGEVIGVIPEALASVELMHPRLTRTYVVRTMHERKAKMVDLSDAFVALPGGYGTLDELFEVTTWAQLGLHQRPIGILDVGGFFAPLLAMLDHAEREGFVSAEHRALIRVENSADALLDALAQTPEGPRATWRDKLGLA